MSSGIGSVTSSNGLFHVSDAGGKQQTVDLSTLMMMLNLDRTRSIDQKVAVLLDEVQKRNDDIRQLAELMAQCVMLKAAGMDDGCPTGMNRNLSLRGTGAVTINGETRPLQGKGSWSEKFGISWTDLQGDRPSGSSPAAARWDAAWDANINALKDKMEMMNRDSQLDNLKLQSLLEKLGSAFAMASRVMPANSESLKEVLRHS